MIINAPQKGMWYSLVTEKPGSKFQLCHLLAMGFGATCLDLISKAARWDKNCPASESGN